MTAIELKIEAYLKWLENEPDAVKVDLTGANLWEANLTGANLFNANLTGAIGLEEGK